jgi:hypothetical protein
VALSDLLIIHSKHDFMAIVKILSRHSPSYRSLLQYILNEAKAGQVFTHNLRSNTIAGYVKELIENESFRKHSRSDQVYLTHEILSFSANEDAKHLTDGMLADVTKEYIRLRGQAGVMLGAVHRDKDHVHIHFCVSALEFRTGKSFGLSKAALRGLKIQLQDFHRLKYPEISQSFPQHGMGKSYLKDRAWQAQHREERTQLKGRMITIVRDCFNKAGSQQNFLELLRNHDLHHYERSGKPAGIEYEGMKFRFSRLLEKEQFESLPVDLSEEQRVLQELTVIREQRQAKDREEKNYEDGRHIER